MKKKSKNGPDIVGLMAQIQAQLAVLDRKLDAFMTKSLTELAEAKAASRAAPVVRPVVTSSPQGQGFGSGPVRPNERPGRPMYRVTCADCQKETEIPFKPTGDRPVYCKECYGRRKSGHAVQINVDSKSAAARVPSVIQAPVQTPTPKPAPTAQAAPAAAKKKKQAVTKAVKKKVAAKKKAKKK